MANSLSNSGSAAAALVFESTTFEVVDQQGQQWLKSGQLAQALGYADETAITKLYSRRKSEFTDSMSQTVNLTVQGQLRETRIFSLRGAHLLAMFARTAIAAMFRKWVLDILDAQVKQPAITSNTISPAQAQHLRELVQLVVETGKQGHGETWNRLHRKMKVNSYLALRPDQFDAACQYLQGKFDDTSIATLIQKHLPGTAVASTPKNALKALPMVPPTKTLQLMVLTTNNGQTTVEMHPASDLPQMVLHMRDMISMEEAQKICSHSSLRMMGEIGRMGVDHTFEAQRKAVRSMSPHQINIIANDAYMEIMQRTIIDNEMGSAA